MNYFSDEYRNKLISEHKLITASILRLTERYKLYAVEHSMDVVTSAISTLKTEKVQLEAKIDVLQEFLSE